MTGGPGAGRTGAPGPRGVRAGEQGQPERPERPPAGARAEETARPAARLVVLLAVGEPERGDDAVAWHVADRLEGAGRDGLEVRRVRGLEVDHLVGVPSGAACLVVDAVVGVAAGEVIVRPLETLAREPAGPPRGSGPGEGAGTARRAEAAGAAPALRARTSHALPLPEVAALAALVRPGLPAGSFVGIGAADFVLGSPLSPAVARALDRLVAAVEQEIDALRS